MWNKVISIYLTASKSIFQARNFSSKLQFSTDSALAYTHLQYLHLSRTGNFSLWFKNELRLACNSIWLHLDYQLVQLLALRTPIHWVPAWSEYAGWLHYPFFLWVFKGLLGTKIKRHFSQNKVVMPRFRSFYPFLGRLGFMANYSPNELYLKRLYKDYVWISLGGPFVCLLTIFSEEGMHK